MQLQAVKLPISHNNVVGENTVLQLNILETGVLTLVVQNSSPTGCFGGEPTIPHIAVLKSSGGEAGKIVVVVVICVLCDFR